MEKKQKRIILIGHSAAGKTTLCQYFSHQALQYHKTQTVQIINQNMIDTPGEYIERTYMRGALMVSSADADLIVLVQDATDHSTIFPPAYTSMYAKPAIGIVTKADLASENEIADAKKYLELAGVQKIFVTSSVEGTGFEELSELLGYE
ncbi:MAG: EutP/PduV family microcompartment system protein [Clostridiaceae bacterium]|nr:EutP/PduV family microcompartment system protein [Butyricicoccus pullicaecorum]MBS7226091.1 EutP/PduV family microcompartment system protein [Clostridiaceae bacterium]